MGRILIVACALLLSSPALAQEGLRSASLPERTRENPVPPDRADQFLAQPDTYQNRPRVFPRGGGFGFFPAAPSPVVIILERVVERAPTIYRRADFEPASPAPALERPVAAAMPAPMPGVPKTFYVIPGCYAGDKRPQREQVPRGCDLRRLRVVPPVVAALNRR